VKYQILAYSKTLRDDGTFRLDAEHYQQQFLFNQDKLTKFGSRPLAEYIERPVMTGHTPSMQIDSYYGGTIKFVKTDNLREFNITGEFNDYLSESGNSIIKRSALKAGDLIVTIIGATHKIVGRAALVQNKDLPANINQNIALIRLKDGESSEFYSAYLNSRFGKYNLWYLSRQTEQVNLNCREVEKLLVPEVSNELKARIEDVYKKAVEFESNSRLIFSSAQEIILSEIGLSNSQTKHQLSFVKNYSDTCKAERIDAEYFQPKYGEIVKAIKSYPGGWDMLENIASVKKCVEVGSDAYMDEGDIPFVRVSNLSPFEITEEKYISAELYAELSQHQPKQGEILFSKDGTPGIAYHLSEKPKKMIPSGGILRLKLKNKQINEDYLTLVLNSMIVQEQINRDVGGSIILHWRPEQVKQTLIPLLDDEKQRDIQQKITESFGLRKQSKHLLECAKQAVEIAIEQNENAAIKWLQEKTK